MAKQHEALAASQQPEVHPQLSSDQCTTDQQHFMTQSASLSVAEAASQQGFGAATAARRQSAEHALVQRFEHMTVARLEISKPGGTGLGLLASAPCDHAPQQSLSEVKIHMPESATDAAV